jgi:hypothetical protein
VTSIGGNAFNGCIALRTVEAKMTQPSTISSSYVFRSVDLSKVKLIIPGGTQSAYQSAGWTGFGVIEIDPNTPTRFVVNASGVLTQYVGLGGNVVIPNEVKSIASTAFSNNTTITSIVIPESVTTINNGAFTGCSSLTSISIPNSVTSIGSSAFYGCNRLASVTIPNSVTSIGDGVFYGCSRLVSVTISEKVTAIGNNAFAGCTALRTVEAKMTRPPNISFNTFQSVDLSKVKLIIPGGTVGVYQSAGWTGFGAIEMAGTPVHFVINTSGELTRYIGPGGDIVIPDEVKSIGNGVFKNNTGITSVVIPEGVTAIGNEAFAGCTALRTVEAKMTQPPRISSSYIFQSVDLSKVKLIVPGGMVTAYQSAGWTGFGTVEMNPNTPTRFIIDESGRLTQYIGPGGNIVIPGEVKTIAASAFQNNTTITSVVIPESVTTIYDGAFAGCSSLTSITIPNSVTSISNNAFQNCSSLTSATIPNSVTYINSQAFSGCSSLTSVTIPNSVTYINSQAFSGCSSLTSVTIPNSVTSISNNAFQNCSSLTSITIPNSVTSLGHAVFAGCSSLAYIIIPNSVTGIGSNAFADCSRLSSVTIANGVTSIGDYAFMNCTGLKVFEVKWFEPLTVSATLFNGVDLSAIKLVVPVGARSNYRQANVWSNFGSIEEYRAGINPIPNIPTPDDPAPGPDPGDGRDFVIDAAGVLTKYTGAGGAVEIPSGVKSIGIRAFENCRTLVSVAIPESVASIGALAFAGCTALKSVSTAWDTPVGITALAFSGVNLSGVTLRVPAGREAAYRSAAVWRTFGSIAAGNDLTEAPATDVYYAAGVLTVDSPVAEQVSVYSAAGVRQFRAVKPAGRAAFAVPRFPRGVWIAAGSSGWTVKFVSIEN